MDMSWESFRQISRRLKVSNSEGRVAESHWCIQYLYAITRRVRHLFLLLFCFSILHFIFLSLVFSIRLMSYLGIVYFFIYQLGIFVSSLIALLLLRGFSENLIISFTYVLFCLFWPFSYVFCFFFWKLSYSIFFHSFIVLTDCDVLFELSI